MKTRSKLFHQNSFIFISTPFLSLTNLEFIFSIALQSGETEFELDSREEVLDTSIWKVHLKAGNLYNYTINIENEKTSEITRKL